MGRRPVRGLRTEDDVKSARDRAIDAAWEMGGKKIPRVLFAQAIKIPGVGDEGRAFVEIMERHIELDRKELLTENEAG